MMLVNALLLCFAALWPFVLVTLSVLVLLSWQPWLVTMLLR
jgi:hypothetical protein